MLTVKYVDALWHWGYCSDAIEALSATDEGQRGSQERITWLQEHLPNCPDCTFANILKDIDSKVAEKLGPEAMKIHLAGGDLREFPEFLAAFKAVAEEFGEDHPATTKSFWDWVHAMRERQGEYPGPARQDAEVAQRGTEN
jgi:hypothetical protein